jgi:hypothetical protein
MRKRENGRRSARFLSLIFNPFLKTWISSPNLSPAAMIKRRGGSMFRGCNFHASRIRVVGCKISRSQSLFLALDNRPTEWFKRVYSNNSKQNSAHAWLSGEIYGNSHTPKRPSRMKRHKNCSLRALQIVKLWSNFKNFIVAKEQKNWIWDYSFLEGLTFCI